jgi:hypothetical protein
MQGSAKSIALWNMTPCSLVQYACLLAYTSTLKMEVVRSSKMSVNFHKIT